MSAPDVQAEHWLDGAPMDPTSTPATPLPSLAGFPYLPIGGCGAVIVGPTGGGRSTLLGACLYDGARAGLRCAYLGSEVSGPEFDARAADIATRRGDEIDAELVADLARVRYLDLASVLASAWAEPERWIEDVTGAYDVLCLDPLSAVASALNLDFDKSNSDWIAFYDRLILPLTGRGVAVAMVDNIGHAIDAKDRARGPSAKGDRADLTFHCSVSATPPGLRITAKKVRSVRAGHKSGDTWIFTRADLRIESQASPSVEAPAFRPTAIMAKVSKALADDPGLSKRALRTAIGGRARNVDLALELLIAEEFIEARQDGAATRHYPLRGFTVNDADLTVSGVSRPCPDGESTENTEKASKQTVSAVSAPCPDRVPDTLLQPCPQNTLPPVGGGIAGHGAKQAAGHAENGESVSQEETEADDLWQRAERIARRSGLPIEQTAKATEIDPLTAAVDVDDVSNGNGENRNTIPSPRRAGTGANA